MKSIFYFEKLDTWDKVTMGIYVVISIVSYLFYIKTNQANIHGDILIACSLTTQVFFYMFNYKSLRNLKVYFFWLAVGIIHFCFYWRLKDEAFLENGHLNPADGLRNTLVLLVLFQILRFISIKTQGKELVCPGYAGSNDTFDDRKATFVDYILLLVYFSSAIGLLMINYRS